VIKKKSARKIFCFKRVNSLTDCRFFILIVDGLSVLMVPYPCYGKPHAVHISRIIP